ncbi:D-alanyl-D-alanine carboxypeptidase family protein [Brevibacterium linens]|uniref:D-alanyl-D-alanine carboxypeptidase family protein n=1 Tax=Brevibacterium linens TaxID=1703 RepID=UPI003F898A10
MKKVFVGVVALFLIIPIFIVVLFGGSGCADGATPSPRDPGFSDDAIGNGPEQIPSEAVPWIEKTANSGKYRYPVAFVAADMFTESTFDPQQAVGDSNGGTRGLTQINRHEWKRIYGHDWNADENDNGVADIYDPLIHAEYAAKLWDENIDKIKNYKKDHPDSGAAEASDLELLLVAHNAGFSRVESYPEIPESTKDTYIPRIKKWAKTWGDIDITTTDVGSQPTGVDPQAGGELPVPQNDDSLNLGAVKPHVQEAAEIISEEFGITDIGGYRAGNSRDPNGHPAGLAIDVMVPLTDKGKKQGDEVAEYVIDNHETLNVKYVIWQQRIMNFDTDNPDWESMSDRGSATQNHMDHNHISFNVDPDHDPGEAKGGGSVEMPEDCPVDGGGNEPPKDGKNKPGPWGGHSNGEIPTGELKKIPWADDEYLRSDATDSLLEMNNAFKKEFSTDMGITDAYRDLAEQEYLFDTKPKGMAATPGKSNHGWALAVDYGTGINRFGTQQHEWMKKNAGKYGWQHPDWAQQGQRNAEAWHWEYYGLDK